MQQAKLRIFTVLQPEWREASPRTPLPGNQDVHNDKKPEIYTVTFDYCLVWGANSFEEMEPRELFNASEMVIRRLQWLLDPPYVISRAA